MMGFDFMIEAATGAAYLIEMNPRNTPICAVRLGPGRDLAEAPVARISGRPVRERPRGQSVISSCSFRTLGARIRRAISLTAATTTSRGNNQI
jgi:hypothetical protein